MSKYNLYLNLIFEMCQKLEKTSLDKLNDADVWDATLMRFQVIGENLKKIPKRIKSKHQEAKWKNFEWFRNQISHEYKTVLPEVIRDLIKNDVSKLKKEIKRILAEEKNENKKNKKFFSIHFHGEK